MADKNTHWVTCQIEGQHDGHNHLTREQEFVYCPGQPPRPPDIKAKLRQQLRDAIKESFPHLNDEQVDELMADLNAITQRYAKKGN